MAPFPALSLLLVLCLVARNASSQTVFSPCPNATTSAFRVGSNIDRVMRSGILPTNVEFPQPQTNGEDPQILLSNAVANSLFLDSVDWENPSCFSYLTEPFGALKEGPLLTLSEQQVFDEIGKRFASAYITGPSERNLEDYVALVAPHWNNSYYNSVRNELIAAADTNGCVDASFSSFTQTIGRGSVSGSLEECTSPSQDFVDAFNALPSTLEGNEQDYIDFCDEYGYYFPTEFFLSSLVLRINMTLLNGTTTTFHLGQAGVSEFDDENCLDPEVGLVQLVGWNKILDNYPSVNVSNVVANNFEVFYETYPVNGEAQPPLSQLFEEQLFTFGPPPVESCTEGDGQQPTSPSAPTTAPPTGTSSSGNEIVHVNTVRLLLWSGLLAFFL